MAALSENCVFESPRSVLRSQFNVMACQPLHIAQFLVFDGPNHPAGNPHDDHPVGYTRSGATTAPAAMRHCRPITDRLSTVAPIPISEPWPTVCHEPSRYGRSSRHLLWNSPPGVAMDHGVVLNIHPLAKDDRGDIPANDRAKPDAALGANRDVPTTVQFPASRNPASVRMIATCGRIIADGGLKHRSLPAPANCHATKRREARTQAELSPIFFYLRNAPEISVRGRRATF